MTFKLTKEVIIKIIFWIAFWAMLVFLSQPLLASEANDTRISKSISFSKITQLDKTTKDVQLKQVDTNIMMPLETQGFRMESTAKAVQIVTISETYSTDFILYETI